MYFKKQFVSALQAFKSLSLLIFIATLLLAGCGSSSSDDDDNTGNFRLYNTSKNSPDIYLTIDEDLTDEDEDAFESTYSGIGFTEISNTANVAVGQYYYEVAFQEGDDKYREDLTIILEGSVVIEEDSTQLMVLSENINSPSLTVYNIPTIDDDNDTDEGLFNLRILNMHSGDESIAIYMSKDDETINEAQLLGQFNYKALSDNQKFDQESYIFYIVDNASNEVVYQSDEISFSYAIQYIISIRENTASGSSPYILDKISSSTVVEYIDVNTDSNIRAYNAIKNHYLLPDYNGSIALSLTSISHSASTESFNFGDFSQMLTQENGDYSLDIVIPETDINLLTKHLVTLPENSDKTVFFYLDEQNVDDDNDGDFDENNDGIVDEVEVKINSLIVNNSNQESIYDHDLTLVNLVDNDDFDYVQFYFVRSNEMIATTPYKPFAAYAQPAYTTLLNNTYKVYIVAEDSGSEIILESFELTLNEESKALFLIIQDDVTTASGYRVTIVDQ